MERKIRMITRPKSSFRRKRGFLDGAVMTKHQKKFRTLRGCAGRANRNATKPEKT
jgi:hypothetical protein